MKTTVRVAGSLALAASVIAGSAGAATAEKAPDQAGVQMALEQVVAASGIPGMVAEVRDGKRTWWGTAGVADTKTGRKREKGERFRIGSATKAFTATTVLLLAAEGKLSLDDTVEKWLPGLVDENGNDGSKITVRMLLNQTSSLDNPYLFEPLNSIYDTPKFLKYRHRQWKPEQLVKHTLAKGPYKGRKPGEGWWYSNTNYYLAGLIVEKATGKTLAHEMKRLIIRPLGLGSTYMPGKNETKIRGSHPELYSKLSTTAKPEDKVYHLRDYNPSWGWAAGNIVSTTSDLSRFVNALLTGKLLPKKQQDEMWGHMVDTTGNLWIPNTHYGTGVFSQKLSCGVTTYGVAGYIQGTYTYLMASRDGKQMVAVNTNGDWNNAIGGALGVIEAKFCAKK
ncbi:serine hydrolase domain-containing protein [Nonomuraea sp. NPDC049152]|uniref:serine hydrolase domain-containing protein n=1 Tax=Nonomuraea sp. NPDC049152 TaxID=3154350 RepID=UPI00340D7E7F